MRSYDDVRNRLDPILGDLYRIVTQAWARWKHLPDRHALTTRSRANLMHDFMIDAARQQLAGVPGIHFVEEAQRTLVSIEGDVILQFKKLDEHGAPRNYPTQQALAFSGQQHIPGIPPAVRITVGYVLDRLGASIKDVMLSCSSKRGINWTHVVDAPERMAEVVPIRTETERTRRVVPKADLIEQRREESDSDDDAE